MLAEKVRSLSVRFIVIAVVAVALSFSVFILLVYNRLEYSLSTQSQALEEISTNNLGDILTSDLSLAGARLDSLFADTTRRVQAIAARSDTTELVLSRNVVAISEVLHEAAENADVDSIVVVDPEFNVIGGSSDLMDLVAASNVLAEASICDDLIGVLETLDHTAGMSRVLPASALAPFSHPPVAPLAQFIIVEPLKDDFGEVMGALIAQRWLRPNEGVITEFSEITDTGLALFAGSDVVASAGTAFVKDLGSVRRVSEANDKDEFLSRCGPVLSVLELCVLMPKETLYEAQRQLTEIGSTEGLKLVRWLGIVGIGSSILLIVLLMLTARSITRPLRRLTDAVGAIAGGNYDVAVEGIERQDEVGAIARAVGLLKRSVKEIDSLQRDILNQNTILEQHEAELKTQNLLFDAALNNMSHGLCMFDQNERLIVSNWTFEGIFGLERGDVMPGMSWAEIKELERGEIEEETEDWSPLMLFGTPLDEKRSVNIGLGDGRTILCTRQPLIGGGWVAIYEDVTERQRARERLVQMTRHDFLTGLPNRFALREYLVEVMEQGASTDPFAVLYLDLDEFKTINDTFGHPAGDKLLCSVADRLRGCVRHDEVVARLGGDEFAIVTRPMPGREEIALRCREIIQAIGAPHHMEHHEALIGVSIGVAIGGGLDAGPDILLMQADLALYRAKFDGRNTYRFFESGMEKAAKARHDMITDLRAAIENDELTVYFQPQVGLDSDRISGFEALMRWRHPRRGSIPASEFISLAEETGLISAMGEWILREATKTAARWPAPIKVAVNVSARQLHNPGFALSVTHALAESGLSPRRLELEVTESVLLQNDEHTIRQLVQLKKMGVSIALDDFGTGYSSLSCLRSFPFDKIKIDRSFVMSMQTSEQAHSIVEAIIHLASSLRIKTTAEGVENKELFDLLRSSGCSEVQGYYIGRPEPATSALRRISQPTPFDEEERDHPPAMASVTRSGGSSETKGAAFPRAGDCDPRILKLFRIRAPSPAGSAG